MFKTLLLVLILLLQSATIGFLILKFPEVIDQAQKKYDKLESGMANETDSRQEMPDTTQPKSEASNVSSSTNAAELTPSGSSGDETAKNNSVAPEKAGEATSNGNGTPNPASSSLYPNSVH